jgi:hypothetical protein
VMNHSLVCYFFLACPPLCLSPRQCWLSLTWAPRLRVDKIYFPNIFFLELREKKGN